MTRQENMAYREKFLNLPEEQQKTIKDEFFKQMNEIKIIEVKILLLRAQKNEDYFNRCFLNNTGNGKNTFFEFLRDYKIFTGQDFLL